MNYEFKFVDADAELSVTYSFVAANAREVLTAVENFLLGTGMTLPGKLQFVEDSECTEVSTGTGKMRGNSANPDAWDDDETYRFPVNDAP
jgi:hypothetical protein